MEFCFYLITDRKLLPKGKTVEQVLETAFVAGVKGVLLREKDLPDDELLSLAKRVRDLTLRHNVKMLVSARPDIAAEAGADGVHLTSEAATSRQAAAGKPASRLKEAREILGVEKYIAVSTHSLEQALYAEDEGADFLTFGPVFKTPSKEKFGAPKGLDALEEVCKRVRIPVFALGGMKAENVAEALGRGAFGIAAISAVIGAEDPALAAKGIIDIIRSYRIGRCV